MRLPVLSALIGIGCFGPALAGWAPTIFEGETKRAIQGCAAKSTDDAWSCAFIRCEPDGSGLGLYLDIPGALLDGPIVLAVDGRDFPLNLEDTSGPFGGAYRVAGTDSVMFSALSNGKSLRIRLEGLKKGYDVIPLAGIAPALRKLNQSCKSG